MPEAHHHYRFVGAQLLQVCLSVFVQDTRLKVLLKTLGQQQYG